MRLSIAFVLFLAISVCQSANFCNIQCRKNRMSFPGVPCDNFPKNNCVFSTDWPSPIYDKIALLRQHNAYRSFIAQGLHANLRSSSNMKELKWDSELEELAREWVSQCKNEEKEFCARAEFSHGMVLGFDDGNSSNQRTDYDYFKVQHVKMWFTEGQDLSADGIKGYKFDEKTARFSQLIWADTDRVGCTSVSAKTGLGTERESLVCMYAPAGNQEGLPVYREGPMLSKCPREFKGTSRYAGLCAPNSEGVPVLSGAAFLISVLFAHICV